MSCATSAGQVIAAPNIVYHRAEEAGGVVLYEISPGESAHSRITNRWADDTGEYFFVWVSSGPGYLIFVPSAAGQMPVAAISPASKQ